MTTDVVTDRRCSLVSIAFDGGGGVISVIGLSKADALAVHNWLGNHVLGCDGIECHCWQAGYECGQEEPRG